jgi:hypothetical protein
VQAARSVASVVITQSQTPGDIALLHQADKAVVVEFELPQGAEALRCDSVTTDNNEVRLFLVEHGRNGIQGVCILSWAV